jgi:uracil-DNA glycosylase
MSATSTRSLDELRREAARCRECGLWREATQTVFGEGRVGARLMLVGRSLATDLRAAPLLR